MVPVIAAFYWLWRILNQSKRPYVPTPFFLRVCACGPSVAMLLFAAAAVVVIVLLVSHIKSRILESLVTQRCWSPTKIRNTMKKKSDASYLKIHEVKKPHTAWNQCANSTHMAARIRFNVFSTLTHLQLRHTKRTVVVNAEKSTPAVCGAVEVTTRRNICREK